MRDADRLHTVLSLLDVGAGLRARPQTDENHLKNIRTEMQIKHLRNNVPQVFLCIVWVDKMG